MLEITLFRENPDAIKRDLKRRGLDEKVVWVDKVVELDREWRKKKQELDELKRKRNILADEIKMLRGAGKDVKDKIAEAKQLPEKIKVLEAETNELYNKLIYYRMRLPNILDEGVPLGKDDSDNVELRRWGEIKKPAFELKHHGALAQELGLADFKRAVKISGAGFYFLRGWLALMDLALMRFAVDELMSKGFIPLETPMMMKRKPYEGVTDLQDFENVMYKIEDEDLYLIATSEHPIAAMHSNEIFNEKELPLKYCGISACFRREIGKHSIDERGLFRVHQFNKIEQFVFCLPEHSKEIHEELVRNAEELLRKLELPHRVVNVCTGDIGTVAAKKYDVEGWSPREEKFIELMSCSNCTSYQSTRLNIKVRRKEGKQYVHTLNSTEVATARTLRLILEHYQTEDGYIVVPKALRPYMNDLEHIPP
jgi:seryl-tRNA synthetase